MRSQFVDFKGEEAPVPEENQRIRLTKQLLKDALLRLMERKPLADVGVSELCKEAGINHTTFYNHYGNPADLFEETEQEFFREVRERLAEREEGGPVALAEHVETICAYLRENERLAKLVFAGGGDVPESVVLLSGLEPEGDDGPLAAYDAVTRKLLMTYLTHGVYSLVRQWLLEDVDKSPAEMGALAEQVATRGWIGEAAR